MLLRYHHQIITLLIGLLLWLPFAGLQAQVIDINRVNIDVAHLAHQDLNSDELNRLDATDNCSSHPMVLQMDNDCVSNGDACQSHSSCCGVNVLSSLENTTNIYIAHGFLAANKSQSVPLLILPTEIKPPR